MTETVNPMVFRDSVREALRAKDFDHLNNLAAIMGILGLGGWYESFARMELAAAPQDVRDWWEEPCPCGQQHSH